MEPYSLFVAICVLASFAVMLYAMILKKISVIVVLPLAAIFWGILAAGNDPVAIFTMISAGFERNQFIVTMFVAGGWMAAVIVSTGIAETIIRKAAELGGGSPYLTWLILCLTNAVTQMAIWGGANNIATSVYMLPIMMALGIPASVATVGFTWGSGLTYWFTPMHFPYLLIFAWGGTMAWWSTYAQVYAVSIISGIVFLAIFGYQQTRKRRGRKAFAVNMSETEEATKEFKPVPWYACLVILLPVILIGIELPATPVLLLSMVYALLATAGTRPWEKTKDIFFKSILDCFKMIAIVALIQFVMGMIQQASSMPIISDALKNTLGLVIPAKEPLLFTLFIAFLVWASIYRGPMAMWGPGVVLIATTMAVTNLNPLFVLLLWINAANFRIALGPTQSGNTFSLGIARLDASEYVRKGFVWVFVWLFISTILMYIVAPMLGVPYFA